MRFADFGWRNAEPDDYTCLAAAYLEAKGYEFNGHGDKSFTRKNAVEKAESLYRLELMMEEQR